MRKIAADLARALDHLHANGRIHADLKPLNAVRVASTWQLIDFDVACAIGEAFGAKVPSSGYCPPEMASVLHDTTDSATGEVIQGRGTHGSQAHDNTVAGVHRGGDRQSPGG